MIPLQFICGFALNAFTDARDGNHGCTKSTSSTANKFCHELEVNSSEDWKKHIQSASSNQYYGALKNQCAFDLKDEEHACERFKILVEANKYAQKDKSWFLMNNEFMAIAVDDPKTLPVKAIYFQGDSSNEQTLTNAQKLKTNFENASGRKVPTPMVSTKIKNNTFIT